jgi:NDP-sugar pyrophosphorylase family protein
MYLAYMNFICGYLSPYTVYVDERFAKYQRSSYDKVYTVAKYNKIIRKNTKIAEDSHLSNNIYVGQFSKIEERCNIEKSIIGKNCIIGKNVALKNCIVLDGCQLAENSSFEYCLIEKVNETIKIHNFKSDIFEDY